MLASPGDVARRFMLLFLGKTLLMYLNTSPFVGATISPTHTWVAATLPVKVEVVEMVAKVVMAVVSGITIHPAESCYVTTNTYIKQRLPFFSQG